MTTILTLINTHNKSSIHFHHLIIIYIIQCHCPIQLSCLHLEMQYLKTVPYCLVRQKCTQWFLENLDAFFVLHIFTVIEKYMWITWIYNFLKWIDNNFTIIFGGGMGFKKSIYLYIYIVWQSSQLVNPEVNMDVTDFCGERLYSFEFYLS